MLKKSSFFLINFLLFNLTAMLCYAQFAEALQANAAELIPAPIRAPAESRFVLSTQAKGRQIYQCQLSGGRYSWSLKAPDAKLMDENGQIVGSHYHGPVWEYKGGSRVKGRVVNKFDVAQEKAVSWLLVKVIAHQGAGLLANVHYINRINTKGGLPPQSGCDTNHLGSEVSIPYSADYLFFE